MVPSGSFCGGSAPLSRVGNVPLTMMMQASAALTRVLGAKLTRWLGRSDGTRRGLSIDQEQIGLADGIRDTASHVVLQQAP